MTKQAKAGAETKKPRHDGNMPKDDAKPISAENDKTRKAKSGK